jgi:hypothetical protein
MPTFADKEAVKLARGTGARLYGSPHLRDKAVGLQSQPPSFVDEDDPLATVALAWMTAVRA